MKLESPEISIRSIGSICIATRYVQGKIGTVERICGSFPNPEELAHNRHGLPAQPLYRVRFRQKDLWPDYRGLEQDQLELELYQHWLLAPEAK